MSEPRCTCVPNPRYDPEEQTIHDKRKVLDRRCPVHRDVPVPQWQLDQERAWADRYTAEMARRRGR